MFLLLVAVISMHQVYATLKQKVDRWPLRAITLRLIEFTGRVFILPFIVVYFLKMITFQDALFTSEALIGVTIAITVIIAIQEFFGVRIAVIRAVDALIEKVNDPDTTVKDLSLAEIIVLNWMQFGMISFSKLHVAKELQDKGALTRFSTAALQIKHLAQVNDLILSSSGGTPPGVSPPGADNSSSPNIRHSISTKVLQNVKRDALASAAKQQQETAYLASNSYDSSGSGGNGGGNSPGGGNMEMKSFQRVGSISISNPNSKKPHSIDPFDPKTINPLARPSSIMAADDSDDEN